MKTKTPSSIFFSKEISNKTWPMLLIIIIAGVLLRCFRLSFQSYWFDEVMSIRHVLEGDFFGFLAHGFGGDPPLYEFLLYFWIKIFGQSEAPVRALSVIFSAATLPAVYLLAKELFDNKTAVYSTLLLSFSAYHIYYAQEARMYALVGFLAVCSGFFFIKALKTDKKNTWVMYTVTTILAFYAHYSALFVVLAETIIIYLFWRKYREKVFFWISSLSAVLIMSFPWGMVSLFPLFIIPAFIQKNIYLWVPLPSLKAVFDTFVFFTCGSESMLCNLKQRYWLFSKVILMVIILIVLLDLWSIFKQAKLYEKRVEMFFLLLWCFLPVTIVYIISVSVKSIYMVRYVDIAFYPLCIIIAHVLARIRPVFFRIIFLSAYLAPNIIALNYYYHFPVKDPTMRDTAHFLKLELALNDNILVSNLYAMRVLAYYCPGVSKHIRGFTPKAVSDIINHGGDFWLITNIDGKQLIEVLERDGLIGPDFNNIYQQIEMKQIEGTKIIRFKTTAGRFNTIQQR